MSMFDGIIGNSRVLAVLSKMIDQETLPHAMLFVGSHGIGKTTVAHALIRGLLHHEQDLSTHPDYLELAPLIEEKTGEHKSNISVEQMRDLKGRLGLSSFSGGWKIVFVENAETFSLGAVNALLKTLEEPHGQTLFILRATSTSELPATIVSRCQILRFSPVPRDEIVEGLLRIGFTRTDAVRAAAFALGCPGTAMRFLQESEYRTWAERALNQSVQFFSAQLPDRLRFVTEFIPKNEGQKEQKLESLLTHWELVFRDVLLCQLGLQDLRVFGSHGPIDAFARSLDPQSVASFFDRFRDVRDALVSHINPHLALEHIALV